MIHQNFQTSLFIGYSPSLRKIEGIFFEVIMPVKIHKDLEKNRYE